MPELPEVEFARACLERWLGGEVVVEAEAGSARVTRGPLRAAFARLGGRKVLAVERRGKQLIVRLDGDLGLLAHLGMTGKFELTKPGEMPPRWSHARLRRADGSVIHYRDPRQLGRLLVAPIADILEKGPLARLGPDAWSEPIAERLAQRLARSARTVKDVLMDQSVVAG
ncbi:MAG TPA: DNA-formamidopyrimidine glycosylase family protein, partial [Polyangiaceae bacterium]